MNYDESRREDEKVGVRSADWLAEHQGHGQAEEKQRLGTDEKKSWGMSENTPETVLMCVSAQESVSPVCVCVCETEASWGANPLSENSGPACPLSQSHTLYRPTHT